MVTALHRTVPDAIHLWRRCDIRTLTNYLAEFIDHLRQVRRHMVHLSLYLCFLSKVLAHLGNNDQPLNCNPDTTEDGPASKTTSQEE